MFFKSQVSLDIILRRIGQGRKNSYKMFLWHCPFKKCNILVPSLFVPFPSSLMQCLGSFRVTWGTLPEVRVLRSPFSVWVIFCLILNSSTLWWSKCVSPWVFWLVCLGRTVFQCVSGCWPGWGHLLSHFGRSGLNKCCGPTGWQSPWCLFCCDGIYVCLGGFCLFVWVCLFVCLFWGL